MAAQGKIRAADGNALKVVFSFQGQQHEVHLPQFDIPAAANSNKSPTMLWAEARVVLLCLTGRAAQEQRTPASLGELCGTFGQLVEELLQACVLQRREDETKVIHERRATLGLLLAAASLGHASAAQQLLRIDPSAACGDEAAPAAAEDEQGHWHCFPAHLAALQKRGFSVLKLLLDAAPGLAHSTCCCVDEFDELEAEWTLMHGAAYSGNVEAIRLMLQLAPDTARAMTSMNRVPLHEAALSGYTEAVRLLLQAAPDTAAALDEHQSLPVHKAAKDGYPESLQLLIDAAPAGLAAPDGNGNLPLHLAAYWDREAAVKLLLDAAPAAALVENDEHRRAFQEALHSEWGNPISVKAACILLPASGLGASQLLDALAAVPAHAQPDAQPLYADLAACQRLTAAQWQRVPAPCAGLGRALPAVLVRSEAEAAQLVTHLPPADATRLRLAALSLHRQQRSLQLEVELPGELVNKMLALSLSDA